MWTAESTLDTTAAPAQVWKIWSDVEGWKRWNAGIAAIRLHGPFAQGTTFFMQPPGEEGFTSTLIAVTENENFSDETIVGDTRVVVHHRLTALPAGGTRIAYATEITGPDAAEVGAMVTADFPDVLAALKNLAEEK